ncbi:MAG: hypothetical protein JST86_07390 [Bacteroidetes bacterium]|nr:hypothetical protein [Bacteroidota bacterium]
MNWKLCITACVSAVMIAFPQNIIGCGPEADPYDYYTSFFHQNLPDAKGYKSFYYTGYNFLYDENEPVKVSDVLAQEWSSYCGNTVTPNDALQFVNKYAWKDLNNLYLDIEKNQPLKIPDSVLHNSMTNYFIQQKDLEGLGYIMYAKQVEPYVYGGEDAWDLPQRDSLKMAKYIKNGQQLYTAAKKDFFKLKYAYQVLRLAHYSGRYNDVIQWYDDYAPHFTSNSVLQALCLSLKAGALLRTGKEKEAAYLFSKSFDASIAKRVSNYLGFHWSTKNEIPREEYLKQCHTNAEKAAMLGLFALGSTADESGTIKSVFQLNPKAEVLEVLMVREINKLEEKYLSPSLQNDNGGKAMYLNWDESFADSTATAGNAELKTLTALYHSIAISGKAKNNGLFETGAAYTAYMQRDYSAAKEYLDAAKTMPLTDKVKDQWALTNLLVSISAQQKIDAAFEEQILPSVQWLEKKAKTEVGDSIAYSTITPWRTFYRNLMSEVLAKRFHQQGEIHKEALAVGAADYIGGYGAIDFLHNNMVSADVEKLYALLENKQANRFETYLINHNSIKKSDVIDFAGTAYLRDYEFAKAITWFSKSADKKASVINTNPFIDLLYDQEEPLASEAKFSTSKMAFATEMLRLQKVAATDKVNAAKYYYKMALGFYNMTYYGHAWNLVQYFRSGSDGYYIPKNATPFQKEYYGCFTAQQYFEKAMTASADKNFKARCLFMMAKCSQKQLHQPQYEEYRDNYDTWRAAEKKYFAGFVNNNYFPQLIKDYGSTIFYKEAYKSCSYLRDFVKRK